MDVSQVCQRQKGNKFCHLHPDKEITSCCKTCAILVCPDCINSKDHDGHQTRYVSDREILDPPCTKLAQQINKIEQVLLPAVEKEVILTEGETDQVAVNRNNGIQTLTLRGEKLKNEIDLFTNMQKAAYNAHYDQTETNLRKHTEDVKQMKDRLTNERDRISDILKSESAINKYDYGTNFESNIPETVPAHPDVQEITNVQFVEKLKYPESQPQQDCQKVLGGNMTELTNLTQKAEPQEIVPEDYAIGSQLQNTGIIKVSETNDLSDFM